MPVRSQVDPCLFIRIIEFEGGEIPPEAVQLLSDAPERERYFEAWRAQFARSPHLVFHEGYHFWQGVRLPFLTWYATAAFGAVLRLFRKLNETADFHEWDVLAPDFYRLSLTKRCWDRANGGLAMGPDPGNAVASAILSPLELLEGAASLAEYQVMRSQAECVDPVVFNRWRKRTPSYLTAFRFTASVLGGDELALRCFVPLVCASFESTDPVRCFLVLLQTLRRTLPTDFVREFVAQPEPCRWINLFRGMLDETVEFESNADARLPVLKTPFVRLRPEEALASTTASGEQVQHPVLAPVARRWLEAEQRDPLYEWFLAQPGWADPDRFWEAMSEFEPPITVLRFRLPDGRNRVFGLEAPDLDIDSRDLLTIWSVVRRAARAHYDPEHRLCHHVNCPEYAPNYCSTYPVIPDAWTDCGFPKRLARLREGLDDHFREMEAPS